MIDFLDISTYTNWFQQWDLELVSSAPYVGPLPGNQDNGSTYYLGRVTAGTVPCEIIVKDIEDTSYDVIVLGAGQFYDGLFNKLNCPDPVWFVGRVLTVGEIS